MTMDNFPLSLLFTIFALALVLVLAWFAIRMLAKFGNGQMKGGRIKLTHTMPLGARERLVLVECDDTTYFLGVTASGISVIDQKPTETPEQSVNKNAPPL